VRGAAVSDRAGKNWPDGGQGGIGCRATDGGPVERHRLNPRRLRFRLRGLVVGLRAVCENCGHTFESHLVEFEGPHNLRNTVSGGVDRCPRCGGRAIVESGTFSTDDRGNLIRHVRELGPADRRLLAHRAPEGAGQPRPPRRTRSRAEGAVRQLQSVVNELAGMRRDMDTDRDERRRASKRFRSARVDSDPSRDPRARRGLGSCAASAVTAITQVYSPPLRQRQPTSSSLPRCRRALRDRIGTTSAGAGAAGSSNGVVGVRRGKERLSATKQVLESVLQCLMSTLIPTSPDPQRGDRRATATTPIAAPIESRFGVASARNTRTSGQIHRPTARTASIAPVKRCRSLP